MKNVKIIAGISCFLMFLFSCTNNDNPAAGNGTRIGNPTIAGVLYQPDGKTPAQGAIVILRAKNTLAVPSNLNLGKRAVDSVMVTTDVKGRFEIDSIDPGHYVIESTDGNNNYAIYESVIIEYKGSSITLPSDTLKPAGAISGTVKLVQGGDPEGIYVLAFGVQRFASVHDDGTFFLGSLAEGKYDLRIISSDENYGLLDINSISVVSDDTTFMDTIKLPFIGTPVIRSFSVCLDTLKQIVILSWDKIDTSLITGLNVYRSEDHGSSYTKHNEVPFTDSVFHDSLVLLNKIYSYRVGVVKKDGTESIESQAVSAQVTGYFSVETIFSDVNLRGSDGKRLNSHALDYKNGLFYAVTYMDTRGYHDPKEVQIFDTNFNLIGTLCDSSVKPLEVKTGGSGRIFVSSHEVGTVLINSVLIYNRDRILEKRLKLYDSLDTASAIGIKSPLFTVDSKDRIIFVSSNQDSIYICDTSGLILKSWGGFGDGTGDSGVGISLISTDINDNIYIYEFQKGIRIYDSEGVLIRTINTIKTMIRHPENNESYPIDYFTGMVFEPQTSRLFITNAHGLSVLSLDGELIYHYNINSADRLILTGRNIYVSAFDDRIIKLKNNLP